MKGLRQVLCTGCLWSVAVSAGAAEGGLISRLSYGQGTADNVAIGAVLELEPELSLELGERLDAQLSARFRADYRQAWIPGEPTVDSYDRLSEPAVLGNNALAELRDFYLEHRLENGLIRLGKQQIVWGALDGVKVLDVLNPQAFDQFILQDFDRSRISLWSLYGDLSLGAWRVEGAAIPDSSTHYLPEPGARFDFRAPRYRFGMPVATTEDEGTQSERPRRVVDDGRGTLALRISRYIGGVDAQFVAVSGLDFEPLARLRGEGAAAELETYHERRTLLGLALAGSLGSLAVRAEVGYSPKRWFNTRSASGLTAVGLEQWTAGVGVDWNAPFDTFVNLQYVVDRVIDAPATLVRPDRDRIVTAFLRRRFNYDAFELQARWYHELGAGDDLLRLAARYQATEALSVELALENFSGPEHGIFGQFRESDLVQLTIEHQF